MKLLAENFTLPPQVTPPAAETPKSPENVGSGSGGKRPAPPNADADSTHPSKLAKTSQDDGDIDTFLKTSVSFPHVSPTIILQILEYHLAPLLEISTTFGVINDSKESKEQKALKARLRRLCEEKAGGKLKVPAWLHEQWKTRNHLEMALEYQQCGFDQDPSIHWKTLVEL